jgi:hypothetical protein
MTEAIFALIGASIGALTALGAVWLQNRHDAAQRDRERQMLLRRDVYFEAAEALAGFPQYLVGFANAEVPIKDLAPLLNSKPGWQNKVRVVAELSTISALSDADAVFIDTAFKVMPIRLQIDDIKRRVDALVESRSQLAKYQQSIHTTLQGQVAQFPSPQALVAAGQLRHDIDHLQQTMDEMQKDEAELRTVCVNLIKELLVTAVERIAEHRLLVAKATLALRREMELPVDQEAYMELTQKENASFIASLHRLVRAFEAEESAANPGPQADA